MTRAEQEDIAATGILFAGLVASCLVAYYMTENDPAAMFMAFAVYILVTHNVLFIVDFDVPGAIVGDTADEWEDIEPEDRNA